MTNEQAKEYLYGLCDVEEQSDFDSWELYDFIVAALDKQTPKKALHHPNPSVPRQVCPCCGAVVDTYYHKLPNYCPDCGQMLEDEE